MARYGLSPAQTFGQAQNPTLVQITFMVGSSSRDASSMLLRLPQTISGMADFFVFCFISFPFLSIVFAEDRPL